MSGFRLAGLLRVRRTQEKLAAGESAMSASEARVARRLHEEARAVLGAHQLAGGGPAGWAASVAARSALRGGLLEAQGEAELAAERAGEAERRWAAARARTRALEQLESRRAEERARQALKEEQRRIDDLRAGPSGPWADLPDDAQDDPTDATDEERL
ncbi:hypothetical protein WDZ16_15725 [Pseudokineococcus marinus]|uniref:flagellar FliJ family protein n=1 Tax=Pseudokineococcus marinus TaxID=351215 RepID=UPI0030AF57CA